MSLNTNRFLEFGPYRLDTGERTLWLGEKRIPLTPKAMDTLMALATSGGRLVEKDALIKTVWPDTFVEDGSLAFQVSLLRKVIGDGFIETVPRRGYRFTEPVRRVVVEPEAEPTAPAVVVALVPNRRRMLMMTAAGAVGTAAALVAWRGARRSAFKSVAVLPFQLIQPTAADEGLGLGLADAVITRLARINKCIVRPTSAVRQFDLTSRDPVAAGVKLGVEAVLDASIQTVGDRLRLNAQLIRVSDGHNLWADTFDVGRRDLFALEDELAARFARSLFGVSPAAARYQPSAEAYRLFTIGRHHRNRWTAAGQRKAIEYFEQAVAIDPGYADAYGLMADSWTLLGYLFGIPPKQAHSKGEALATKALSLDEGSSRAHHAMAVVRLFNDWNFPQAEHHERRALDLDPNDADSLQILGIVRTVRHNTADGVALAQRAVEVDPTSQWRRIGMSFQFACAGRMDAAIEEAKKAHDLDPDLGAPMAALFNLNMVQGRHREAVAWYLKLLGRARSGDAGLAAALGERFEKGGIAEFLRAQIARSLERTRSGEGTSPMTLAQSYAFLGERDEAVRWIEQAVEQRQGTVVYINQHPMYASLRDHPGFKEIVRRIGL